MVACRQFSLQEVGGVDALTIERPGDDGGVAAAGGQGGIHFWSSANDHYPWVRIEQWSGEPPRNPEGWEITRDETFTASATARLELAELFGPEPDAPAITLPRPGQYRVRVHVRGCGEASGRGEAEFFHGVEQWLLQIWPAA